MDIKKKGLCINFGNCKNADNKLPVEVDVSADFICPECERDLVEIPERKWWKEGYNKFAIVAVVFFVVVFGAYLVVTQFISETKDALIDTGVEIVKQSIGKDKDSEDVDKVLEGTQEKEYTADEQPKGRTETNYLEGTKGEIEWKTINFSNGDWYTGETKNKLMHGAGEYHFSARRLISEKDLKRRYAEAGDVLKGSWNEGSFSTGNLFDATDKFKENIIIGQPSK